MLPEASYQPFESEAEAAAAVVQGAVDAFVYDHPYHATFIAMHGDDAVVFLDEPFTDEALAFAIRKDDPNFLAWLNAFLKGLNADGRYERIRSKWFESTDWFNHYQ